MNLTWKCKGFSVAVILLFSCVGTFGWAQNSGAAKPKGDRVAANHSVDERDVAYCKQFLDKDGGYRMRNGGYYNPTAGTYTDPEGLVADNWGGVTYPDGSYKTKFGDYYDAKENVFKLSDGQVGKAEAGSTPAHNRQLLRVNVEQNGGYDKDGTLKSMIERIKIDHPRPPHQ